ncbi:polysaccharide biosynthesis tyrosine autokinase [Mycetocola zhadangensis]|uniref:polysaccharide biosynthesis tyrosine autokinase n=1 Tax=Mycetocola zhadangensis TaxID=1164595 RepID=UPI003A4E637A
MTDTSRTNPIFAREIGRTLDLRDYFRVLRKGLWIIVASIFVGVGAAAAVSFLQTPLYSATAKVFVSTQSAGTVSDLVQGNAFSVQRVRTYSDLVSTPLVLSPVIRQLDLDITPELLAKRIMASAPLDTSIIAITVNDTDPERAAAIANSASQNLAAVVQDVESPALEGAISPVKLTRAQEATVPVNPASPKIPLYLLIGAAAGLVAGILIATLRETLETRIRNESDLKQLTDVAVLGGIGFDPNAKANPLTVHADPQSRRAESFRTLRTNLSFLEVARADRSFVITSSIQSEGKSTTGANLAIALADAGFRVLLVDADLRRPMVANYLGLEGAVGLTDVLIGREELHDVMQPWGLAGLFVLPAGHVPPNPSELLGSVRMSQLIKELNEDFDVVLFDSPPLLPVTDAAILAKKVGGTIMVVAAGRTHKNQLKGALAALANVGAPVSGIVLTMLPTKGANAGYELRYGAYEYEQPPTKHAKLRR